MNHLTHIELLEDRIAPATILNPYTVTFQDSTGDTAIVKISKPLFTNAAAAAKILIFTLSTGGQDTTFSGNGTAEGLTTIDLLGRTDAQDLNISVKVIPQVGVGNGQVDVGSIEAANFSVPFQVSQNIDLGTILIQGNLGQINAGDNFSTPAITSLTVNSMNQGLQSDVLGPLTKMKVLGDFNANLDVLGYQFGSIGSLTIGGSLAADAAGDSGTGVIQFSGHVGTAVIGNITGGAANNTGELVGTSANPSSIGSVHVLGSITGGAGEFAGVIFAQASIGKATVDGNVIGGSGSNSGEIQGPLGTVSIAGSVVGGSGQSSGVILGQTLSSSAVPVGGTIKSISVGGDVIGNSGAASGQISGILGTVNIHGNLTGGSGIGSGSVIGQTFDSQGNAEAVAIGNVTIIGNVTGGTAGVAAGSSTSATPGDTGIISGLTAKTISISGSLIGGTAGTDVNLSGVLDQTADTSGAILVNSLTSLKIGGSITGGTGPHSGLVTGESLAVAMNYGSIAVKGDVAGGVGATSGSILVNGSFGGVITSLNIGGSLTGSSGTQSGVLYASSILGTLTIGGNVTGGTADNTGSIFAGSALTSGVIKGNLTGGAASSSAAVVGSGYIQAGSIGALDIMGNVSSGSNSSGATANNGAIRTSGAISSLTIGGTVTGTSANPVIISAAEGVVNPAKPISDLAIGSVTIGQAVNYLDILAGYGPVVGTTASPASTPLGTPFDGSAQIGTVSFGSTLAASNVVAGAEPDPATGFFGTSGNNSITAHTDGLKSVIAKIIVAGTATGDATPSDSFGFVAQNLGIVTVDGVTLATGSLTPGTPVAVNGTNLHLLEVT